MSSGPPAGRWPRVALAVLAVLVLAYSVVIATEPLLGIAVVLFGVAVSLAWRFVQAFERIADALEAIAAERAGDE